MPRVRATTTALPLTIEELVLAASRGDIVNVRRLLGAGLDVDGLWTIEGEVHWPLSAAALCDCVDVAVVLLNKRQM